MLSEWLWSCGDRDWLQKAKQWMSGPMRKDLSHEGDKKDWNRKRTPFTLGIQEGHRGQVQIKIIWKEVKWVYSWEDSFLNGFEERSETWNAIARYQKGSESVSFQGYWKLHRMSTVSSVYNGSAFSASALNCVWVAIRKTDCWTDPRYGCNW